MTCWLIISFIKFGGLQWKGLDVASRPWFACASCKVHNTITRQNKAFFRKQWVLGNMHCIRHSVHAHVHVMQYQDFKYSKIDCFWFIFPSPAELFHALWLFLGYLHWIMNKPLGPQGECETFSPVLKIISLHWLEAMQNFHQDAVGKVSPPPSSGSKAPIPRLRQRPLSSSQCSPGLRLVYDWQVSRRQTRSWKHAGAHIHPHTHTRTRTHTYTHPFAQL